VLAELAKGRLRAKLPALREALEGRFRAHHALLLGELLAHLDDLDEAIDRLSNQVARAVAPFSPLLALLITIPGSASGPLRSSSPRSAPTWASSLGRALGELGGDLPGRQRVGRQAPRGHHPKGARWRRVALIEAANAAARGTGTYLASQDARLKRRRATRRRSWRLRTRSW
jgi:transposase